MMLEQKDEADFLKLHIWNMFLEVSSRCWYLQSRSLQSEDALFWVNCSELGSVHVGKLGPP